MVWNARGGGNRRSRGKRGAVWLLAVALTLLPGFAAQADEGDEAEPAQPTPSSAPTHLAFQGRALFKDLGSLGQEEFRYDLVVANATSGPIEIRRANLLLAHEGGWLLPLDPDSFDGSYFSEPRNVEASTEQALVGQKYRAETPATHTVFVVQADDGHAEVCVPVVREGHPPPAACNVAYPFGLGVVGPLHALPFSDGTESILLIGQHQVLSGAPPENVETSVQIGSDAGAGEPLTWAGLDAQGDLVALWPFVRRIEVFTGFTGGYLRISSTAKVHGREVGCSEVWPVEQAQPVPVRAPVLGTWQASNGPGRDEFIDHYANPQLRYAYDLVVLDKEGRTHKGDPHTNESYFAWNRPVRAVADGEVVDVCVQERDNPGYRGTMTLCHNNRIVIKHDDGLYTAYLHLKRKSVANGIVLNRRVKAWDVLARVGNSGDSSEPHLHFMAFRIGRTGRIESVPVTFTNAFHDAACTQPVRGVPLGGHVYTFCGGPK